MHFLFVGGGPRRLQIEAFIRSRRLANVTYLDYVAREELGDALAAGDMHLISLRGAFAGISVPGKLYGIMAASRPVLFVGPAACETADAIRDAGCGVVVDPADDREGRAGAARDRTVDRIVATIDQWRDDPATARAAGARGRTAWADRYRSSTNCAAFGRVVAAAWPEAAGGGGGGGSADVRRGRAGTGSRHGCPSPGGSG